jgi:uncharacterized protein
MGFREFNQQEIEAVLEAERVVRLGLSANGALYVVPVFFVWHGGAVCGLTTPGRKTEMAAANPSVAFQVDSTAATGHFTWASVSGEGAWEVVADPAEFGPFARAMREKLADAPEWASRELNARFAEKGMVPFRIRPTSLRGRSHGEGV